MTKIKNWLFGKFLPAWCRDDLLETNRHLVDVISDLKQENERLNAYIDGIHAAVRRQPRITINCGEVHKT
ncbi:hypothetical protein [Anaeromassilibacillus senegalensis]|uniref:hypothetical protein n=1 Tax=Anaeromassilibacillus senegalensis TaxID=1673717 RepID=UPI0006832A77|nr:hypothetical protein [Anaeromassilibacillus senegalensis]